MSSKATPGDHGHSHLPKSLEKEGWELFNKGSWPEALAEFGGILHADPSNEGALQGKAASLRKMRKFSEAAQFLAEALVKHPGSVGLLAERVWLYVDQRRYSDALFGLDEVFRFAPATDSLLSWRVLLLRNLQRFDEAHAAAREALRTFPNSEELPIQVAWLHFYQNHLDEAEEIFEEVLSLDQKNEEAHQGKIATLRLKGSLAEAKRQADSALTLFPKSAGIYGELGWIGFAGEDFGEAARCFRIAQKHAPNDPFCRVNLAWALCRECGKETLREAAVQCQCALDIAPNLAEALGCLGVIAFRQGRIHEAETYLLRSIKADAARGQYADLGALYVYMGRFEDAKKILETSLALKPQEAALHLELGNLYTQMEEPKRAILEFRQAMALDPGNPDSPRALAISLLDNDKTMEAEAVLRHALRNIDESKRWKLHLSLSRVLTRLADDTSDSGPMAEALKHVNAALRLRPDQPDPHFCEGIVRFKLEDYSGSLRAFRRCCEIDGNRVEAEVNARRVQAMIREAETRRKAGLVASMTVGIAALLQLGGLWYLRLRDGDKSVVSPAMITVLVPICLGLLVVAVLLPSLTKLKLTGLEADLSEPKPSAVASGPKGQIDFGRGAGAGQGFA